MKVMYKLIGAVVLFCLAGCAKKDGEGASKGQIDGLQFGEVLAQSFGSCDSVTSTGARIGITLWKSLDTSAAAFAINSSIESKVIDRINSHADSVSIDSVRGVRSEVKIAYQVFATNYKNFKADFPEAPGCWEVEITGDTVMVTSKLLMYKLDHYAFTGGAHPNTFRSHHIFDGKTGTELSPFTFVADTAALLNIVEKEFRKKEKLGENVDLEEAGYFLQNHKFFLPANFTFSQKGVLFYYNAYEIAAYVKGAIEFVIPYDQLEGIVKKEQIY